MIRARRRTGRRRRRSVLPVPRVEEAAPLPRVDLDRAVRLACTCVLSEPRVYVECPACAAWTRGRVLLDSGQQVPKTHWLQAQEPPLREGAPA